MSGLTSGSQDAEVTATPRTSSEVHTGDGSHRYQRATPKERRACAAEGVDGIPCPLIMATRGPAASLSPSLLLYQHNEQARAALKYSSKKPTRRNAKHQADERRKRHNKKRKQHTRDETDTTTMENRISGFGQLRRLTVANIRARSVRTLRDPALTWGGKDAN